ncbi:hypothetical protein LshimejAT787_3800110 [Lyophyllum shimeji]|uniref:Uncharacterized protein n=1 Tax=Lyophyllum shimeji TaxID=47721 RepID=A0A9P3PZF3_LYOSH|nr:hypothetical protein LshimejAT787_3800110 [Lyophyllum shimeji]
MSARSDLDASFVIVGDNTGAENAEEKPVANEVHPSNSQSYLPGSVPIYAHDWSVRGTGQPLRIHGRHFVDGHGDLVSTTWST